MSRRAWIYISTIYLAAAAIVISSLTLLPASPFPWLTFLALTLLGLLTSFYRVNTLNHAGLNAETIFFFAGLFLLPFWMFTLQVSAVLLIIWLAERLEGNRRRAWYIQPFNISKDILAGYAALMVFAGVGGSITGNLLASHNLIAVIAAGLVYAFVNNTLLAYVLYLARNVSLAETRVLKDIFIIEFPQTCLGYSAILAWNLNPWLMVLFLSPMAMIYQAFQLPKVQVESMRQIQQKNEQLEAANNSIQRLNKELFQIIARMFDARDPLVGGHVAQVARYAEAVAREMGFSPERAETLRQAAYLHDLGKLAIPEAILNKASPLTRQEFITLQRHSSIGAELIATCEGLRHLAPFIRHHHERWDGLGYPDGLCGEEIPLEARILNVCDSVETMASDRPYRTGLPMDNIIAELKRCRGTQFDPVIADLFVHIIEREGVPFLQNSAHITEGNLNRRTLLEPPVRRPHRKLRQETHIAR